MIYNSETSSINYVSKYTDFTFILKLIKPQILCFQQKNSFFLVLTRAASEPSLPIENRCLKRLQEIVLLVCHKKLETIQVKNN